MRSLLLGCAALLLASCSLFDDDETTTAPISPLAKLCTLSSEAVLQDSGIAWAADGLSGLRCSGGTLSSISIGDCSYFGKTISKDEGIVALNGKDTLRCIDGHLNKITSDSSSPYLEGYRLRGKPFNWEQRTCQFALNGQLLCAPQTNALPAEPRDSAFIRFNYLSDSIRAQVDLDSNGAYWYWQPDTSGKMPWAIPGALSKTNWQNLKLWADSLQLHKPANQEACDSTASKAIIRLIYKGDTMQTQDCTPKVDTSYWRHHLSGLFRSVMARADSAKIRSVGRR